MEIVIPSDISLAEHKTGFCIKTRSGALLTNLISPKPERTFLGMVEEST
jgi:hypothetical protein